MYVFFTTLKAQLLNHNKPKILAQATFLSQITSDDTDISDVESIFEFKVTNLNNNDADLMKTLRATKTNKGKINKKKDQKIKQINTTKQAKILNENFDYIHIA